MTDINSRDWEMLGILPALGLPSEASASFAPFEFVSFEAACRIDSESERWRTLVEHYTAQRQAPPVEHQAVVFAQRDCHELVATLWPLLMLAFTGWGRRSLRQTSKIDAILSPENFFSPAVTPYPRMEDEEEPSFTFQSSTTRGFGFAENIPLWWGVDEARGIQRASFDMRIHAALAAIAEQPDKFTELRELRAIGAAADLCCASMTHYPQKISNVAPVTRRMTLLMSGFEALHRVHENVQNRWNTVATGVVERFKTVHRALLTNVLSSGSVKNGELKEGANKCVLEFALHRMAFLRNRLAHGWNPDGNEYKLDEKIGGAHIETLSRLLLTILIGQDLMELAGGPRNIGTANINDLYGRDNFSRLHDAHLSGMAFDSALNEGLVNPFGQQAPGTDVSQSR